jgi:acyl-coenzyme A synthetase/AMP-(fatty) acid ligase
MTGNAANWFVDRHIAEGRGAKTAFEEASEGGRQLTYGALAEGAGQVAEQVGIATPVVGARWRIQSWRIWP